MGEKQYSCSNVDTPEEQPVTHIQAVRKPAPSAMAQQAQAQHATVWMTIKIYLLASGFEFNSPFSVA